MNVTKNRTGIRVDWKAFCRGAVTNAGFAALHALPVSALLPSSTTLVPLRKARARHERDYPDSPHMPSLPSVARRCRCALAPLARHFAPSPLHFRPPTADRSSLDHPAIGRTVSSRLFMLETRHRPSVVEYLRFRLLNAATNALCVPLNRLLAGSL